MTAPSMTAPSTLLASTLTSASGPAPSTSAPSTSAPSGSVPEVSTVAPSPPVAPSSAASAPPLGRDVAQPDRMPQAKVRASTR